MLDKIASNPPVIHPSEKGTITINSIKPSTMEFLRREGGKRNMKPSVLCRRILDLLAEEGA